MSTITKQAVQAVADLKAGYTLGHADVAILNELARIALASLEAEAVCVIDQSNLDYLKSGADADVWPASRKEMGDVLLYRAAPPAPVSVPDEDLLHMAASAIDDLLSNKDRSGAGVWADIPAKLRRAAMLQGADRPQNETQNIPENIPATQFKPVADLYGLTSPTGSETSFTFDAVEARDFIGGGWSCQEYVELERFQEAVSGNSPVIPDGWQLVPKKITLEMECALSRADSYEIGWRWALAAAPTHSGTNDGWVACSERMPGMGVDVLACTISPIGGFEEIETAQWHGGMKGEQPVFITSADAIEPTHWMPLPAAPLQEVK
ncbi:DUF551 domain-containing protein [Enterobacter roggenkampii]|uniref:DUF551 domain-containing protein n=1 Tax=Enterobacter roggenkampii TaxID=1812935 RepID=UPI00137797A7|nr:DUF551 domain-containing protein [Enterobacter roggenkampii]